MLKISPWQGDNFEPDYFNLQEVKKVLAGYCKE
jgi:hypothetical protein